MSTLEIMAALILAIKANDRAATARLLETLETRLPPEEVIEFLATIGGETPVPSLPPLVACA